MTPPLANPDRPSALKKPPPGGASSPPPRREAAAAAKGQMAPVTPPKASPAKPPGEVAEVKKALEKGPVGEAEKRKKDKRERSPQAIGLEHSTGSSESQVSPRGDSQSKEEEASDKERKKSRSPIARRAYGRKQKEKERKGLFGRVKFADPIDNRGEDENQQPEGGGERPRNKGKGKGKGKSKSKSKKGKAKGKGKSGKASSPSKSGGKK